MNPKAMEAVHTSHEALPTMAATAPMENSTSGGTPLATQKAPVQSMPRVRAAAAPLAPLGLAGTLFAAVLTVSSPVAHSVSRGDSNGAHRPPAKPCNPLQYNVPMSGDPLLASSWLFPRLRREIRRHGQGLDVSDQSPNTLRAQCAAKGRHAPGSAVVDRVEDLIVGAAIAPASVRESRSDPPRPRATMAAIAIHRRKQLLSVLCRRRVAGVWISQSAADRGQASGREMCLIADRRGRRITLRRWPGML